MNTKILIETNAVNYINFYMKDKDINTEKYRILSRRGIALFYEGVKNVNNSNAKTLTKQKYRLLKKYR
jgi:hypothetical protein